MAIKFSYTNSQGFLCPEAYLRIVDFDGDKDDIRVGIWIYKDQQARIDNLSTIDQFRISLQLKNGATMEQMYIALKQDDNLTDAADC